MEFAANAGARSSSVFEPAARLVRRGIAGLGSLSSLADLGVRLWVANVFFTAGLTKISNWSSTLALFESEYHVPLLPPELAAYLGTAAELGLPVFIALGLGTRFAALALFLFNIVAAVSYPDLSELGLKDHQMWGLLILVTLLHGPGKLSLDHLVQKKFFAIGGK